MANLYKKTRRHNAQQIKSAGFPSFLVLESPATDQKINAKSLDRLLCELEKDDRIVPLRIMRCDHRRQIHFPTDLVRTELSPAEVAQLAQFLDRHTAFLIERDSNWSLEKTENGSETGLENEEVGGFTQQEIDEMIHQSFCENLLRIVQVLHESANKGVGFIIVARQLIKELGKDNYLDL